MILHFLLASKFAKFVKKVQRILKQNVEMQCIDVDIVGVGVYVCCETLKQETKNQNVKIAFFESLWIQ